MRVSELLAIVNLPDLIAQEWGSEAIRGLNRERGGVICDRRAGQHETHPSFSVYKNGSVWRWKRHGGDWASGNAYRFLLECGYTELQAREELARHAGVSLDTWQPNRERPRPTYLAPDPLSEARGVLARCAPLDAGELCRAHGLLAPLGLQDGAGRDLERRGLLGWPGLRVGELRHDFTRKHDKQVLARAGALGVLLPGPDGQMWGLKVRNIGTADELQAAGLDRYVYRIARHGAPAWSSPGYGNGQALLITEGELNGAAASLASEVCGLGLDVQGLAGAGGTPHLDGMAGRVVYLYADSDAAGLICLERLGKLAQSAGALEVRMLAPLPEGDFCELLGSLGAAAFGAWLEGRLSSAELWQSSITGKTALPQIKAAPSEGKGELWQSGTTYQNWTATDNGWGMDRGGW